jgi:hypothetical protein
VERPASPFNILGSAIKFGAGKMVQCLGPGAPFQAMAVGPVLANFRAEKQCDLVLHLPNLAPTPVCWIGPKRDRLLEHKSFQCEHL